MPAVVVHPNNGLMALQSMNNEIHVYASQNKFNLNRKKKFTGHQTAGYACQMAISPDGKVSEQLVAANWAKNRAIMHHERSKP